VNRVKFSVAASNRRILIAQNVSSYENPAPPNPDS